MVTRKLRIFALIMVLLLIAGCNEINVADNIDQRQANKIVAILSQQGISATASRETGGRGLYSVEVRRRHYSEAVTILSQKGLPGKSQKTFSELVSERGLLPSSREVEALRVDHLKAVQLEELLSNHPGATSSTVVVRDASKGRGEPPSVSIVIQEHRDSAVDKDEITELIRRSVPGVDQENIFVSTHVAAPRAVTNHNEGVQNEAGVVVRVPLTPFLFKWRVAEDDYDTLVLSLIGFLLIMAVIGGLVGYWYGYYQQSRRFYEGELSEMGPRVLRAEQASKKLPEA